MDDDIKTKFGKIIQMMRKQLGISQEELADRARLHRTYIGDIERGKRNISLVNISKISRALKLNMSEFFEKMEKLP